MKHYCYLHLSAKKPKAQVQCQGHTVNKWQEKNSNLGQPDSKDCSEPWLCTPPTYKAIECFDYHLKRTWQRGEPLLSTSFLTQLCTLICLPSKKPWLIPGLLNTSLSPGHTTHAPWNSTAVSSFLSSHRAEALVPELGMSPLYGQKLPLHAVPEKCIWYWLCCMTK